MNTRTGHADKTARHPRAENIGRISVNMDRTAASSLAWFAFAFLSANAAAIAIIPPAIYLVTLSFGALLANAVAIMAGWAILLGITGREKISGKPLSETLDAIFGLLGKSAAALLSIFLAALLLQPATTEGAILAGLAAGAAYFAIQYLASYRETRLLDRAGQSAAIKASLVFSALVVLSTVVAVVFSLQTRPVFIPVDRAGQLDDRGAAPAQGLAMPLQKTSAVADVPTGFEESASVIYVNPTGAGECRISIAGQRTYSLQVRSNCRRDPSNFLESSYCPLAVELGGLPDGTYQLVGAGACEKKAQVAVENGAVRLVG